MKTISVSEFRGNIKKYLDIAQEEKLIIHRGKGRSFAVVPIEEIEESPYDPEFVKKILQAREDSKQGLGVKIAIEDLWK
ncbi:MAG: type II toxin-antitoxin system Phd/YefM family antitoxin [Lentimicrobium sp.]|jgi:prevent-host-death family protein|nr:type II toxin-antitoxin system Phd/YefM family antitoxin [Lentimicrobium sp.]